MRLDSDAFNWLQHIFQSHIFRQMSDCIWKNRKKKKSKSFPSFERNVFFPPIYLFIYWFFYTLNEFAFILCAIFKNEMKVLRKSILTRELLDTIRPCFPFHQRADVQWGRCNLHFQGIIIESRSTHLLILQRSWIFSLPPRAFREWFALCLR